MSHPKIPSEAAILLTSFTFHVAIIPPLLQFGGSGAGYARATPTLRRSALHAARGCAAAPLTLRTRATRPVRAFPRAEEPASSGWHGLARCSLSPRICNAGIVSQETENTVHLRFPRVCCVHSPRRTRLQILKSCS